MTNTIPARQCSQTPCVLVVDDQPANVALLERLLASAGLTNVHGLTDPYQAVQRCLDIGADLVLLDLHMPGMDGFAVLSALRAALPPDAFVPVLVLTADSTAATRDRALLEGAKDFLTKPLERTEVILRVRNLLEFRALYVEVQARNAELRADIERRNDQERRSAEEHRRRQRRVESVLTGDVLRMVFQPIADLVTGDVMGAEALSRFEVEPRRPPNEWFDEAASIGRGTQLELAAVRVALGHLDRLAPDAFLALNVSPATASDPEFARLVDSSTAHRVVIELTEHTRIDDYDALLAALGVLRDRGVRVAVDDTGAGYASMQHVLLLRPDIFKLDIKLTQGIDSDSAKRALTTALVAFAAETNAVIVAEGIETPEELDTLRSLGIAWGQGYYLARPGGLPLPGPRLSHFPR